MARTEQIKDAGRRPAEAYAAYVHLVATPSACGLRDVAPCREAGRRPRTQRCDGYWHGTRDQRGFTLIELLVVVIILGLLAALVGPRLLGRVGQSKQAAARVQIELLGASLDQFKLDAGRYPSAQEGLQALQTNPGNVTGWEGPYLKKNVPQDPWGNAYQYKSPGDHGEYDLWSYGADNAPGGDGEAGDITSWGGEGRLK